eukprot:TRINITY_DN1979_c0_g1_i1.p1 TRINITY_DN1979_c0_g1~~TRINITY_DN1979_c0_g1_i1.p1  ORF type:complete len:346 (+),score=41.69 TRINITY_DN1979_c0_g1_i1:213-1250(+)
MEALVAAALQSANNDLEEASDSGISSDDVQIGAQSQSGKDAISPSQKRNPVAFDKLPPQCRNSYGYEPIPKRARRAKVQDLAPDMARRMREVNRIAAQRHRRIAKEKRRQLDEMLVATARRNQSLKTENQSLEAEKSRLTALVRSLYQPGGPRHTWLTQSRFGFAHTNGAHLLASHTVKSNALLTEGPNCSSTSTAISRSGEPYPDQSASSPHSQLPTPTEDSQSSLSVASYPSATSSITPGAMTGSTLPMSMGSKSFPAAGTMPMPMFNPMLGGAMTPAALSGMNPSMAQLMYQQQLAMLMAASHLKQSLGQPSMTSMATTSFAQAAVASAASQAVARHTIAPA